MNRSFLGLMLVLGGLGLGAGTPASAQTIRFTTNVGSFDMTLNPTNNPNLQPLVDNLLAYVGMGRYHFSAINRAADSTAGDPSDDFVLQMGGFLGFPPVPNLWTGFLTDVEKFEPVVVDSDGDGNVDFSTLTNDRGTVSLALAAGDPNSGTSSFFINLGDNAFLDDQRFVPFARIEDMSTVDRIMALDQLDLSSAIGQPGNLAFIDVPVLDNGRMVVVTDVNVIAADPGFSFVGPIATALQIQRRNAAASSAGATSLPLRAEPPALARSTSGGTLTTMPVPEPHALALLLLTTAAAWQRPAGR
jgi:cyclophilin family peptidyl-prolyl cis-trans isomerase